MKVNFFVWVKATSFFWHSIKGLVIVVMPPERDLVGQTNSTIFSAETRNWMAKGKIENTGGGDISPRNWWFERYASFLYKRHLKCPKVLTGN